MTDIINNQQTTSEDCIAALDIGSNSFHFVMARIVDDNLQILHSEKFPVRLADGLDKDNILSQEAMDRGLEVLTNLSQITEGLTTENFRIVATYTLRKAKNGHRFLSQAADVFPFDIEVISGHEEARLIYQGVSHFVASDTKHLVIDIGGGSTECIIGTNDKISALDSLNIGCVSFAKNYFANGDITKAAFRHAVLHASIEIEALSSRFINISWKKALGTSGTIKSIYKIINQDNELPRPITLSDLYQLRDQMIDARHIDNLAIPNLKESRRAVICPGLAILIALMEVLAIKELSHCAYALREGVLLSQLDMKLSSDIHQRTISSLMIRFNVEQEQSDRVMALADNLFQQVKDAWQLNGKHYKKLLAWAISLHEIGLDINPSGFHRHGKYIIENASLAGFNQEQTQAIAYLVGHQRRQIQPIDELSWFLIKPQKLASILVILRLACLFSRQRHLSQPPEIVLNINDNQIELILPEQWLEDNSLINEDLLQEQQALKILNFDFTFQ